MLSLTQFVNIMKKKKCLSDETFLLSFFVLLPGIKSELTKGMHDGSNDYSCVL